MILKTEKLCGNECENPFRSWLNMILTCKITPNLAYLKSILRKKTVFWDVFGGAMFERVYISMWWHRDFKKVNRASKQQKRTSTHPSSYIMHKSSAQSSDLMALAGAPEAICFSEIPICFVSSPAPDHPLSRPPRKNPGPGNRGWKLCTYKNSALSRKDTNKHTMEWCVIGGYLNLYELCKYAAAYIIYDVYLWYRIILYTLISFG